MNIHGSGTVEQFSKTRRANREHGRQAYRRRQRVPTTHPVPEPEDVLRFDPELVDVRLGRAHRGEMRADRAVPQLVDNPGASSLGVDHRLRRGERLRRDYEQGLLGLDLTEHIDDVCGIDIGDEMTGDVRVAVGAQCLIRHRRTQVRATNADVDNVRDSLAGGSPMGA